jgi:ABC-type glycerol-3-phosphate transport system permease component
MLDQPYTITLQNAATDEALAARRTAFVALLQRGLRVGSAALSGYHGARRNGGSIFWGAWWFGASYLLPFGTYAVPAFALAQGFGKMQTCSIR